MHEHLLHHSVEGVLLFCVGSLGEDGVEVGDGDPKPAAGDGDQYEALDGLRQSLALGVPLGRLFVQIGDKARAETHSTTGVSLAVRCPIC